MNKNCSNTEVFAFVPSYNHAQFVEECLKSVFNQTLTPKKLLVIDDGSQDDSPKIIDRILKRCPFEAELVVRENLGLSRTLNEGLAKTEGDYFAYIGSDDLWLPEFLAERIKLLDSRPKAVLAFGHSYLIDQSDLITDCTKNWTNYADGNMLPLLLKGIIPLSPSVVYRRSALEKYGWNENSILEDYELYLKLSKDGEFAFDHNIYCAWRQHGWNVSKDFSLMLNEWLEAQIRVAEHLNISSEELQEIQSELKFNSAADLIRAGKKKEAVQLLVENLKYADSVSKVGKILLRLAIPTQIFQWNRKRKFDHSIKKFGKLEI